MAWRCPGGMPGPRRHAPSRTTGRVSVAGPGGFWAATPSGGSMAGQGGAVADAVQEVVERRQPPFVSRGPRRCVPRRHASGGGAAGAPVRRRSGGSWWTEPVDRTPESAGSPPNNIEPGAGQGKVRAALMKTAPADEAPAAAQRSTAAGPRSALSRRDARAWSPNNGRPG